LKRLLSTKINPSLYTDIKIVDMLLQLIYLIDREAIDCTSKDFLSQDQFVGLIKEPWHSHECYITE
jgi:hypothetical protein